VRVAAPFVGFGGGVGLTARHELFVQQAPDSMESETTTSICRKSRETVRVATNQRPDGVV
jgi:hypothetical protein